MTIVTRESNMLQMVNICCYKMLVASTNNEITAISQLHQLNTENGPVSKLFGSKHNNVPRYYSKLQNRIKLLKH